MWHLTLHRWTGDPSLAVARLLDAHLTWMQRQQLAGKVLMAGPIPDKRLGISGGCYDQGSSTRHAIAVQAELQMVAKPVRKGLT